MGDRPEEPGAMADVAVQAAMVDLVRRSGDGELTVGSALAATTALRDAADRKLFELVRYARDAGASWAEIGAALGVSTQAAHQRYGRSVAAAQAAPTRPAGGVGGAG